MVKRFVYIVVGVSFLFLGLSKSEAFWGKAKKDEEVKPATETKTPAATAQPQKIKKESKKAQDEAQRAQEARRMLVDTKRAQLNDSEWVIELQVIGQPKAAGKPVKKENDVIMFKNNQVSLSNLSKQGFQPTNYTLAIADSGVISWETMQRSDKGNTVFLKGEIDQDLTKMTGVLNNQVSNKATVEYYFSSTSKKDIARSEK